MQALQLGLGRQFGREASGPGIDLTATGHQFNVLLLHTRDGVNVTGDFHMSPKNSGLQRSMLDRCETNIIIDEFSGNRIEFERVTGVCRLLVDTSAYLKSGSNGIKMLM